MWKKYISEILSELNNIQQLPNTGLLAGGAIANLIWEKVSGNKAVINDIDIFRLVSIKDIDDADYLEGSGEEFEKKKHQHFTKVANTDLAVNANQSGYHLYLNYCTTTKSYYRVLGTDRSNMINVIDIESNENNPYVVIGSFDLNCTQVAYDLETNKLYYTEEFNEFLQTGIIEIVNINTPSHSLLRLLNKRDGLNAKVNIEREVSYIKLLHKRHIRKNIRFNFSDKYLHVYEKYKDELKTLGFELDTVDTSFNENLPEKIYCLKPITNDFYFDIEIKAEDEEEVEHIYNLHCLNFYYKYIYGNEDLKPIWNQIGIFWVMGKNYFDGFSMDEVRTMSETFAKIRGWVDKHEMMLKSLFGLTLKEQIKAIVLIEEFLKDKAEIYEQILKITGSQLNFDSMEDVEEFFGIQRIKNRAELARLEAIRLASVVKKSDVDDLLPF